MKKIIIVLLMSLILISCVDSQEVKTVKNGVFKSYPNKTLEEAVKGFVGNPKWESIVAKDGNKYVNIKGNINYRDKTIKMLLQYKVDGNNFELQALEFNGIPQNLFIYSALMTKMLGEKELTTKSSPSLQTMSDLNETTNELKLEEDWKIVRGEYSVSIVGKVKNNSSQKYSYTQITFNLYDKEGAQIGTALANISGLEAGGVWKFKALVFDKDFSSAKLNAITAY